MRTEHFDDLSPEERKALQDLGEFNLSSPELEDAVVDRLIERKLIGPQSSFLGKTMWALSIAALLLITFFMGMHYGRYQAGTMQPEQPAMEQNERKRLPRQGAPTFQNVASNQLTIEEYRDEPARPGGTDLLFSKAIR